MLYYFRNNGPSGSVYIQYRHSFFPKCSLGGSTVGWIQRCGSHRHRRPKLSDEARGFKERVDEEVSHNLWLLQEHLKPCPTCQRIGSLVELRNPEKFSVFINSCYLKAHIKSKPEIFRTQNNRRQYKNWIFYGMVQVFSFFLKKVRLKNIAIIESRW